MTQREKLEAALRRHGCKQVDTYAGNWGQWTTGDLLTERGFPERSIYVGQGSLRVGRLRTQSAQWPRLMARLLAEPVTAGADCPLT